MEKELFDDDFIENDVTCQFRFNHIDEVLDLSDLPSDRWEEKKKNFLYRYTMGLEPKEIFIIHQSEFQIEDSLYLPLSCHRVRCKELLDKMDFYYSTVLQKRDALTRFKRWLIDYTNTRIATKDSGSLSLECFGPLLDEGRVQKVLKELLTWIEEKLSLLDPVKVTYDDPKSDDEITNMSLTDLRNHIVKLKLKKEQGRAVFIYYFEKDMNEITTMVEKALEDGLMDGSFETVRSRIRAGRDLHFGGNTVNHH